MSTLAYYLGLWSTKFLRNALAYIPRYNCKVELKGELPKGKAIITSNHQCKAFGIWLGRDRSKWIDHFVLGSFFPDKVHFMIRAENEDCKPYKFFMKAWEGIPTRRIRKALFYLDKGEKVCVFAQGRADKMKDGKWYNGAAWLAKKSLCEIYPLRIASNTNETNNIFNVKTKKITLEYKEKITKEYIQNHSLEEITAEIKKRVGF